MSKQNTEIPQQTGMVGYGRPPVHSRFKPGNNANPGGRPRNTPSLTNAICRLMAMSDDELKKFKPANQAEKIAFQRLKDASKALNKDTAAAQLKATEMIMNRVDGPLEKRVVIDASDQAALLREARTRFAFFLEYNARFAEYQARVAARLNVGVDSLPSFDLQSVEQIIEITVSQFPEASHEAVLNELYAMVESGSVAQN